MTADPRAHPNAATSISPPGAGTGNSTLPGACARCGRDADFEIADLWLCVDCYHVAGSTCAGIGTPERPTNPVC